MSKKNNKDVTLTVVEAPFEFPAALCLAASLAYCACIYVLELGLFEQVLLL